MKVALTYNRDLHFKASVRNVNDFNVDEPASFHGTNLGPSAVEYLLVGIGGCLGTTFIYCLQKMNIELNACNVLVDGKLSHIGPKKRLKLVNVDVEMNFSVKETTTKERINQCVKEFRENCIVTSSIADGLPITVNCNQI